MESVLERFKVCKRCKETKSQMQFNKNSKSKDRFQYNCRSCSNQLGRQWKLNNPERNSERTRRWRKNNPIRNKTSQWLANGIIITPEQYIGRLAKQNYRCALCQIHRSDLNVDLAPDHDHKTGQIRGLLCQKCNRGLGHFGDNIERLQKAIEYLKLSKIAREAY